MAAAVRNDTLTPWLPDARDVYDTAARFAFGLAVPEARATNVTGALNVLERPAARPALRRLVHISGYRVDRVRVPVEIVVGSAGHLSAVSGPA